MYPSESEGRHMPGYTWAQPACRVGNGSHTHNGGMALGQLALVPCMEAGADAAYSEWRLVSADSSGMVPDSVLL